MGERRSPAMQRWREWRTGLRERFLSPEPKREDPRGKTFVMVYGGHGTADVPQLVHWRAVVEDVLAQTPDDKKVMLYIEAGDMPLKDAKRLQRFVEGGMSLSDAVAQARYEDMPRSVRGSKGKADQWRPHLRKEIENERLANGDIFAAEVTHAIDALLAAHPGRFVIVHEGQPDDVIAANFQFKDEINAPLPALERVGGVVPERLQQLQSWAANQNVREGNSTRTRVDSMERVDIGAGVGLEGAWHYEGVDSRLRETLGSPDDPQAHNVRVVFPESPVLIQNGGRIIYPVNPQLALMRRIMDGEMVSAYEVQLALESEAINFSQVTAEQAILAQTSPAADAYISDWTVDTVVFAGVHPAGPSPDYYRQQARYIQLKLAMHEGTQPMEAVQFFNVGGDISDHEGVEPQVGRDCDRRIDLQENNRRDNRHGKGKGKSR